MDTVETRDQVEPAAGSLYDGFISYSHAADDLLAPRLQAGLQRFAKPWWKRRALRIFRDESSLSANPHLWSSITDALDQSNWFVLLLSPDAAQSEWVNQEVEYWLEHKGSDRIIPVVTDGEFRWAETNIDLESTAAPPALYGAFADEPRWVDLRFARSEDQLDLNNPRFSAAVADVASAIRGVPKDELESEEVRQHRRTIRTAWAGGAVVLLLAVVAGGAALFALDQQSEADAQRRIAEENAADAEANAEAEAGARTEAEANATEAQQQRDAAEQQAAIAQGRELTLEAEKAVESDPELSTHLALAALSALQEAGEDSAQAVSVLRTAIESDRIEWRVPGGDFVAVHPDGTLLATADGDDVAVWDIATHQVVKRYARQGEDNGCSTPGDADAPLRCFATDAAFSPDGNLLAVLYQDADRQVTIWDRTTEGSFTLGTGPGTFAPQTLVFSPDGEYLAFWAGAGKGVEVWSLTDRRRLFQEPAATDVAFGPTGTMAYIVRSLDEAGGSTNVAEIRLVDPATRQLIDTITTDLADPLASANTTGWLAWSPDGAQLIASNESEAVVLDVASGEELTRFAGLDLLHKPRWLTEGDAFVVGGVVDPRVIDAATGDVRMALAGLGAGLGTWGYAPVPGTSLVASAALGPTDLVRAGDTVLFDTAPVIGEVGGWQSPVAPWRGTGFTQDGRVVVTGGFDDGSYVTSGEDGSDSRPVQGGPSDWFPDMNAPGTFVSFADPTGRWMLADATTGDVVYEAPVGWTLLGAGWDGSKAVIRPGYDAATDRCGSTRIVATLDGSVIAELSVVDCPAHPYFSPDGTLLYLANFAGDAAIFDTETGERRVDLTGTPYAGIGARFSPDGTMLVVGTEPVYVLDVASLVSGGDPDAAVTGEIPANGFQGVWVSPDGAAVATSARDEPLKLWDLATRELIGELGGQRDGAFPIAAFHPSLPHLLVTSPPNEVRVYTLDVDELIEIAQSRLTREMTADECQQYFRGPCP